MFRDYLVGFLVSCALFLWLCLGTHGSHATDAVTAAISEDIELVQLPEVQRADEEPLPAESAAEEIEPVVMAPPQTVDIPSTVPVNDSTFFQQLAVPPPPGATADGMVIPKSQYLGPTAVRSSDAGVFVDKTELDSPPRIRVRVNPSYPTDLQMAGVTGYVLVQLSIEIDGSVSNVRVLSATNERFEQAVLLVVRKWHFEPGKINGKKVRFRTTQPFDFALQE
jgi:TonB family protein